MAELVPLAPASSTGIATRLQPLRQFVGQPAVRRALPAIGSLGGLALAGLAWFALQTPTQRPVFEGLGEADKAAVAQALTSAGVPYGLDRATGAVTVGEGDYHRARMMLAGQGLPKAAPAGDALLAALPMGASRAVEGETLRGAREADIARTIEAIDSIKTARVHLAVPEPSAFLRDEATATASIMLTMQAGRTLGEAQVRAIQHLVASSVPEMKADDVSVVDQSGQLMSSRGGLDDRSLQLQTELEDRARRALAALLAPLVGADGYTAEVHADLDLSETQSTRETYPKDDRALRSEVGNKTTNGATTPAMGIPGATSNTPPPAAQLSTTPPAAQTAPPANGTSEENYTRAFDVGREISVTHQPVGRLRRLSVAVAIRDGAKPRSAKELATIEQLVRGAVGYDAARGDVVAIASRPFVDPAVEQPPIYDRPWFVTLLRQGGALVGALLAFVLIGRPIRKALKARSERLAEREVVAGQLLEATSRSNAVTLDMIEAAPSYEAKANLVRAFVRQDQVKAASVVRELMARGNG